MSLYAVILLVGTLALLTHHSNSKFLYLQFSLSEEANFPTWVASIMWLLVAIASYIANITDRLQNNQSKIWLLVSCAFLYASMDEICRLHERIPRWQFVYIVPIMLVFTIAGPFLWRRLRGLPKNRICLIAAAACYLMSLGLEFLVQIPSIYSSLQQIGFIRNWNPIEFTEEMIELLGTALLVHALFNYSLFRWNVFASGATEISVETKE